MNARTTHRRSGFTLVELMIALALLALVVGNVFTILSKSTEVAGEHRKDHDVEDQARRLLDRIANEVVGAYASSLEFAGHAPFAESSLKYETYLGITDGATAVSDAKKIDLAYEDGWMLAYREKPGEPGERRVVWSKWVPELFEGEGLDPDGDDDNGNGLIDEPGLSFVQDGRIVRIYLTIKRRAPGGDVTTKTLSAEVAVRN